MTVVQQNQFKYIKYIDISEESTY